MQKVAETRQETMQEKWPGIRQERRQGRKPPARQEGLKKVAKNQATI